MKTTLIALAIISTIAIIAGVIIALNIYNDIYPYKDEMNVYYIYEVIGNDTIPIDTIIFKKIK